MGLPIFLWIIRWAAICYSRYAVGRDGRTAYERLKGRACKAVVVPMGVKVWYKKLRAGERQSKPRLSGSRESGLGRLQEAQKP